MMSEQQMPDSFRQEAMRAQIQGWLMEEGWKIGVSQVPDAIWFLAGVDESGRHIGVGQKQGSTDQIVIQGSINVADEHQTKIAAMNRQVQSDLIWNLRIRLLMIDVEFSGIGLPLQSINVAQRIYFDGLSKDAFLQRVSQVRRGILMVLWTIGEKFSDSADERQIGFKPGTGG